VPKPPAPDEDAPAVAGAPAVPFVPPLPAALLAAPDVPVAPEVPWFALPLTPVEPDAASSDEELDEQPNPSNMMEEAAKNEERTIRMGSWSSAE
jgi:hypothetical protein